MSEQKFGCKKSRFILVVQIKWYLLSLFQDEDIERIDAISTFEELKDMEEHFRFYYSRDREAIKAMLIKKRKEEREDKKRAKKAKKAEKKAKKMKTITNEEGKEIEL